MVIVPFILWHTGSYQFFSIFVLALVELWGLRLTINWLISFKNLNSIDWRYVQLKEKHPKLISEMSTDEILEYVGNAVHFINNREAVLEKV